jgi:hypothetical protein
MEEKINRRLEELNNENNVTFDDTLPIKKELGSLHPVTIVAKEVTIF